MGTGWGQLVSWLWCLISPSSSLLLPSSSSSSLFAFLMSGAVPRRLWLTATYSPSQRSRPCLCEDSPLSVLYSTPSDESFLISCLCCGSSGVCQSVSQVGSSQRCKNSWDASCPQWQSLTRHAHTRTTDWIFNKSDYSQLLRVMKHEWLLRQD